MCRGFYQPHSYQGDSLKDFPTVSPRLHRRYTTEVFNDIGDLSPVYFLWTGNNVSFGFPIECNNLIGFLALDDIFTLA